jgi:hypothetical protein
MKGCRISPQWLGWVLEPGKDFEEAVKGCRQLAAEAVEEVEATFRGAVTFRAEVTSQAEVKIESERAEEVEKQGVVTDRRLVVGCMFGVEGVIVQPAPSKPTPLLCAYPEMSGTQVQRMLPSVLVEVLP